MDLEEELQQKALRKYKAQQQGVNAGYSNSPLNTSVNKAYDQGLTGVNENQQHPGKLESAARGLGSGLTFGFYPQVSGAISSMLPGSGTYEQEREIAKRNQEAAYQENPNIYRSGYGIGAIAPMATGLGELGLLGKGAATAAELGTAAKTAAAAAGTRVNASALTRAAAEAAQNASTLKRFATPANAVRATGSATNSPTVQNFIDSMTGKDRQGPGSKANDIPNNWEGDMSPPKRDDKGNIISQNEPSKFESISEYLRQANPDNPRIAAMNMQRTPEGRAMFNEESPEDEDENYA